MYCPSCGRPRADLTQRCPECSAPPLGGGGSGWAWFFAGSTLMLAVLLAGVLWALGSTGTYAEVLARLGPTQRIAAALGRPIPPAASGRAAGPAATAAPAASTSVQQVKVGEIVSSGDWKLVVNSSRNQPNGDAGSRLLVDFTVKNDGSHAAVIEIPSTAPQAPRARPAVDQAPPLPLQPIQASEPPTLRLSVADRAGRSFGGSFVGADGQPSGSYSLVAAPSDAVGLTYAFDVPASSAEPFTLDALFAAGAGGAHANVRLDQKADQPAALQPSDVGKAAAKGEAATVGDLWRLTVSGVDVGNPASSGERTVTVHLEAENLTDEAAVVAGPRGDTSGPDRDFYAVDAAGHLAYSSSDTMPTATVPAKASRAVDVKLHAPKEFATSGPWRFTVVVDPAGDRYAVFRIS